jgi:acetyl/propionyl-CoA carboxylase alpha subunit
VDKLEEAYARCQSEATASFGKAEVYVEEFAPRARHIEVQVLGDLHGRIAHLGERECSIQRRHQKLIEIAPAPWLDDITRRQIIDAALRLAEHTRYYNVGTFEFLLDVSRPETPGQFFFIEANARLQVEHTVTEEVTGVDIVRARFSWRKAQRSPIWG